MKKTLYQALGVEANATDLQIAEGYARCTAAIEAAPYDRNAQIIAREAFQILSNPDRRALYDMSLSAARATVDHPDIVPSARSSRLPWAVRLFVVTAAVATGIWLVKSPDPVPVPAVPKAAVTLTTIPHTEPKQEVGEEKMAAPTTTPPVAEDLTTEELFAKLAPAIVRINVSGNKGSAIGSGVVIAPKTVITNCHVAQAGNSIQVKSGSNPYGATLILADEEHDLCKLHVPYLTVDPVQIGSPDTLRTGQKVVALGAPHGLDLTISEGIVSSLRKVDDGPLIQTTAPVSPGSSGGGLFDMGGNLIGIVTFQMRAGQNLNFAAPAQWIAKMSATRGNGIIAKLAGAPHVEDQRAKVRAEQSANIVGSWSCRETIRNHAYAVQANEDGDVEIRRDGHVWQGRWRAIEYGVELRMFDSPRIQVAHLDGVKLILDTGTGGIRLVCARD